MSLRGALRVQNWGGGVRLKLERPCQACLPDRLNAELSLSCTYDLAKGGRVACGRRRTLLCWA